MHWLQLTLKCCFLWTDRWDPASSEPCQWDLFSMEVGAGLFSFLIRNETYSKHRLQSHGLTCSIYSAEQRPGWESRGARNRHWAVITLARWADQVSAAGAAKQPRVPWNTKIVGFSPSSWRCNLNGCSQAFCVHIIRSASLLTNLWWGVC